MEAKMNQNQNHQGEELLTARDVARQLRMSAPHIYAMSREGVLKSVRVPAIGNTDRSVVRFRQKDINEFVERFNK
jgi:excisionase family DNA binding protein